MYRCMTEEILKDKELKISELSEKINLIITQSTAQEMSKGKKETIVFIVSCQQTKRQLTKHGKQLFQKQFDSKHVCFKNLRGVLKA